MKKMRKEEKMIEGEEREKRKQIKKIEREEEEKKNLSE